MTAPRKFPDELRSRALRLVLDATADGDAGTTHSAPCVDHHSPYVTTSTSPDTPDTLPGRDVGLICAGVAGTPR